MVELVESVSVRLNKALEIRQMKPVELSKATGISESTISQYRSGYATPKAKKLKILADALNVEAAWLMGMNCKMKYEPKAAELDEITLARFKTYAGKIALLDSNQQETIYSVIDAMLKRFDEENAQK